MKVNILKVFNGDCIHISYKFNNKPINIVIDSGPRKAYQKEEKERRPPRKTIIIDGEFKKLINRLKENKEIINLLIITHVDNDHIGGVLSWIESIEFNSSMIGKIWFNSGQLINEYFNKNIENNNEIKLDLKSFDSVKTSIPDGVSFEKKIKEYKIWDREIIKAGDMYKKFGANFLILSPTEKI
jgi:beta-lactamase superfamily II metal-dependent hydrolase